jgi:peptide/nickel transport system permease protein
LRQYLVRRFAYVPLTILGVSLVVFMGVHFLPGDVISQTGGEYGASTPAHRRQLEKLYALDRNIGRQAVDWLADVARGNLGTSIFSGRPVTNDLRTRLPATIELGLASLLVSAVVGISVGVISAVRQNSIIDLLTRGLAIGLLAIPSFWLGLLILTYAFVLFHWTPPLKFHQFWEDPARNVATIWLPSLVLGASLSAGVMRLTRSAMLEVLRQDYVRTARAKGLKAQSVVIRHALRNSIIPVVTVIGLQVPLLIGGTVIIESVFSIPGMGSYLVDAIGRRDYPVVQAIVLLSASSVVISNFVVDCLYPVLDPRIRLT